MKKKRAFEDCKIEEDPDDEPKMVLRDSNPDSKLVTRTSKFGKNITDPKASEQPTPSKNETSALRPETQPDEDVKSYV